MFVLEAPVLLIDSLWGLTLMMFVAGSATAPTLITGITLVQHLVPRAFITEGMAVAITGLLIGLASGTALSGILVDSWGAHETYALPVAEGSATQQAEAILTESTVVGAFHNVSAVLLEDPEVTDLGTDVLVLGDDRAATDLVQALADTIPGVRGVYGGRTRNAHQVEALTANLISINRRYKAHSGLRVTDI